MTMPVTRYSCPLPTCNWALDYAAADVPDVRVDRSTEGHLVLREDFLASVAYRASHRSLRAVEDAIGEHLGTHTAGDWMKAFIAARTEAAEARSETENARAWWGHWKRRAITVGVRLGRALEQHRSAMDTGGIASGICTCGEPHPCSTTRAAGPRRPSWEVVCDCAPACPAHGGVDADAPADVVDGAWGSVWLHGKWEWLTKNMTTEQREYAADAVARWDQGLAEVDGEQGRPEPEGLRWWKDAPAAAGSPYTGGLTRSRTAAVASADETGSGHRE